MTSFQKSDLTSTFSILNISSLVLVDSSYVDEQMIRLRGKHSEKMFIKGKPIRFGY